MTSSEESSPTNSTPPEDEEGKKTGKRPRKPRNRPERYGKVLSNIRKEQSGLQDSPGAMVKRVREYGHGSTLHLGSSATSWRLGEDVMEAALSYHLAQLAISDIESRSVPTIFTLSDSMCKVYGTKPGPGEADLFGDALLACYQVIGARKSNHTAIIGSTKEAAGIVREPTVYRMADRAITLVEDSKLLTGGSPRALFLVELMQFMLHTVVPSHPFASSLAQRSLADFFARPSSHEQTQKADAILGTDALKAVLGTEPLRIADSQLILFGWTDKTVPKALQRLEQLEHMDVGSLLEGKDPSDVWLGDTLVAMRTVGIYLIRELAKLKGLPGPYDQSILIHLQLEGMVDSLQRHSLNLGRIRPEPFKAITDFVSACLLMYRMCLVALAARWVEFSDDQVSQLCLLKAQRRFLHTLGVFARTSNEVSDDNPQVHAQSLLFFSPDIFFDWTSVAIRAANEDQRGEGSLAGAGFSLGDLVLIQRGLKEASSIFALAAARELRVRMAIVKLTAPEAAHTMVQDALSSLE